MAQGSIKKTDVYESDLYADLKKSASEANSLFEEQIKLLGDLKGHFSQIKVDSATSVKAILAGEKQVQASVKTNIETSKLRLQINRELANAEREGLRTKQEGIKAEITAGRLKDQQIAREKRLKAETERQTKAAAKAAQVAADQSNKYKILTKNTNAAQAEFKRLAATYGLTDKRTKAAERSFQKLDKQLRRINNRAKDGRRDVGIYEKALRGLKSALGVLGVGAGLSALAGVARNVIGVFTGFEKSLSTLKAVSGATKDEIAALSKQAKELGATTAFTAGQVVELQTEFAKLGFPVSDIQNMTQSTLDAAAAMGSGLGETAKLTGATLKAFGLASTEAARVNDVLAKATSASALDFAKLSASMSTIAPVANSFGFSIEGTVALLGQLSNAGFDASSAATATRNLLLNLADANGKLAKSIGGPVKDLPSLVSGLEKLKKEGIDLGEALELTDKRSVAAFATFLDGTDAVLELNDKLEQAGGTAQQMADTQLDNLAGAVTILNSAWEGFILSIESGDGALARFLRGAVESATALLGFLSGADDVKQSVIELGDETVAFATKSRDLVSTYEDLADKTNLTSQEKYELARATDGLIDMFGESVVSINKETGALELNIDAIKRQIQTRAALGSEAVQTLLAERNRLQLLIDQGKLAETQIDNLFKAYAEGAKADPFDVPRNSLVEFINLMRSGADENEAFAEAFGSFDRLGIPEQFRNVLNLIDQLPPSTKVAAQNLLDLFRSTNFLAPIAEEDLARIDAQLKALGIDLTEIAKDFAGPEVKKDFQKGGDQIVGILNGINAKISEARKAQRETEKSEEIKQYEESIKLLEDQKRIFLGLETEAAKAARLLAEERANFENQIEQERFKGRIALYKRDRDELLKQTNIQKVELEDAINAIYDEQRKKLKAQADYEIGLEGKTAEEIKLIRLNLIDQLPPSTKVAAQNLLDLFRSTNFLAPIAEEDLARIDAQLKALGIDLTEIAKDFAGPEVKKDFQKGGDQIVGILNGINAKISEARKAQRETEKSEEIKQYEESIKLLEDQKRIFLGLETEAAKAARLLAEERANFENQIEQERFKGRIALYKRDRDELLKQTNIQKVELEDAINAIYDEQRKKLKAQADYEIGLEGKTAEEIKLIRLKLKNDLAKLEAGREDELANLDQLILDKEKETNDKRVEETKQFVSTMGRLYENLSRYKLQQIDNELASNKDMLEEQRRLRDLGADYDIGTFRRRQAELEKARQDEAEKAKDIQKVVAFYNAFAEFAKTDPEHAAIKAGAQVALAETLVGFFHEGTERVGDGSATKWRNTGKDDYLMATDLGERVVPTHLNDLIGDMSNKELANLAFKYQNGLLTQSVDVSVAAVDAKPLYDAAKHLKKEISGIRIDFQVDRYGRTIQRNTIGRITNGVKHDRNLPN